MDLSLKPARVCPGVCGVCGVHFKDNVLKKKIISVYRMERFPPGFRKSVSVHSVFTGKKYSEFSVTDVLRNFEDALDL